MTNCFQWQNRTCWLSTCTCHTADLKTTDPLQKLGGGGEGEGRGEGEVHKLNQCGWTENHTLSRKTQTPKPFVEMIRIWAAKFKNDAVTPYLAPICRPTPSRIKKKKMIPEHEKKLLDFFSSTHRQHSYLSFDVSLRDTWTIESRLFIKRHPIWDKMVVAVGPFIRS